MGNYRCWKAFVNIIVYLGLVVVLAACREAPPVVKIGLVAPFEGQYRAVGYDAIYSARLAVREVNEAGGIGRESMRDSGRYYLSLTALDDGGDPEMAAETAKSLVLDPDVVAVIGHWLPEETAAAASIYQNAGLPLIAAGEDPFLTTDPETYPLEFLVDYAAVTPFDETAGPYAGATYDAFYLVVEAMERVVEAGRPLERNTVTDALQDLRYEGITGEVYRP